MWAGFSVGYSQREVNNAETGRGRLSSFHMELNKKGGRESLMAAPIPRSGGREGSEGGGPSK